MNMNENLIKLAGLWKDTSANGDTYLSGQLAKHLKILVFKNKQKQPGSNQPDYHVFIKQLDLTKDKGPSSPPEEDGL